MEIIGQLAPILSDAQGRRVITITTDKLDKDDAVALLKLQEESNEKKVCIDIRKYVEKRSTQANRYMWELCGKLAEKLKLPKIDIYRKYIYELGICKNLEISESASKTFIKAWEDRGLGWIAEVLEKNEKYAVINAYYGSSSFNKNQMQKLIKSIVEDCKLQGIETKTPQQIEDLINLMKGEK